MELIRVSLAVLLGLVWKEAMAGSCPNSVSDYFCGSLLDTTRWSDNTGVSTGGAKVELTGQAAGGVRLQGRKHLVSADGFLPAPESGVVVEGRFQFESGQPQSREFTVCTRSDGEALIQGTAEVLLPPSPGIRSSTSKFFVQNGACLHLSSDEISSNWRMTILFVGEVAQQCQASNTIDLDMSPGSGEWAFELSDRGDVLTGKVTGGVSTQFPDWIEIGSGTCQDAMIGSHSDISSLEACGVLCDDNGDQCGLISFSSAQQTCTLLAASCIAADLTMPDSATGNLKSYKRSTVYSVETTCSESGNTPAANSHVSLFDGYQECTASATTTSVCVDGKYPSVLLNYVRIAQTCSTKDPLVPFARNDGALPCPFSGFAVPESQSLAGIVDLSVNAPAQAAQSLPGSMLLLLLNLPRAQYDGTDISTSLRLRAALSAPVTDSVLRTRCPRFPTPQIQGNELVAAYFPLDADDPSASQSDPFQPGSEVSTGEASATWQYAPDPAGDPRGAVELSGAGGMLPYSEALNPPSFSFSLWMRIKLREGACSTQYVLSSTNSHTSDPASGWALFVDADKKLSVSFAVGSPAEWRTATDGKAAVVESEWTQVVVTLDVNQLRVYANGRLVIVEPFGDGNAFTPNTAEFSSAPAPIVLGGMANANLDGIETGTSYAGVLDEVVLYARALSVREEEALWWSGGVVSNPTTATGLGTHVSEAVGLHGLYFCPGSHPTTYRLDSELFETTDMLSVSASPAGGVAIAGGRLDPTSTEGGDNDVRATLVRLQANRVRSTAGELAQITLPVPAPSAGQEESSLPIPSLHFDTSSGEDVLLLVQFPSVGVAPGGVDNAFVELVVVVDGFPVASKVAQLPAVVGDLSGTRAFKAMQVSTVLSHLSAGTHACSLVIRLLGQSIASSAVAQGPWSMTAVRSTKGSLVESQFSPQPTDSAVAEEFKCSTASDAPQSARAGSEPSWSPFPAPLELELNVSSSSQSVLVIADLGRVQAEVVAIMSLRIAVRSNDGDVTTAAMTAVPIFNGGAGQAPTFHGALELGPGRHSLSVEYWSPSSPFAYRQCDIAPPQHRIIAFSLPEAALGEPNTLQPKVIQPASLPVAAAANLVRSCGCDRQDPCEVSGGSDAPSAADGDTQGGCSLLEGAAGERGNWMVDFGSIKDVDSVMIWLETAGDAGLLDHGSVHVGMSAVWSENPACGALWSNMVSNERVVTVACAGSGRYLFVVAAKDAALPVCEVEARQTTKLSGAGFLSPAQHGQGLVLDGSMFANPCSTSQGVSVGGDELTLTMWVRIDSSDMLSGGVFLVDMFEEADHSGSTASQSIRLSLQDGVVTYSVFNGACDGSDTSSCVGEELSATDSGPLNVDVWTHLSVIHLESDLVSIHIDAVQVVEATVARPVSRNRHSCLVGMGWSGWAVTARLVGAVRDIFLWNTGLPSSDLLLVMDRISIPSHEIAVAFANEGVPETPAVAIRIGGSACERTTWTSPTAVGCVSAPGVGRELATVLTLPNRGLVTKMAMFDYQTPVLSAHEQPLLYGDVLTIAGVRFGLTDYSPAGRIGDSVCEMSQWRSDSSVLCVVPSGVHTVGLTVSVAAQADAPAQQPAVYAYQHPVVTGLQPATASFESIASGSADHITLFGHQFGDSDFSAVGQVGSTQCLSSQWVSSSAIVCALGGGVGTGLSVKVVGAGSAEQSCVSVRTCSNDQDAEHCQQEDLLNSCHGNSTLDDATQTCTARGGRLCRRSELESDTANATLCTAVRGTFWTQTPCCDDGGRPGQWVQSSGVDGHETWTCSTEHQRAQVKCCFVKEKCWQLGEDENIELTQAFSYTAPHVKELEFSYEFARQFFVDKTYNGPPTADQTSIWMVGSDFGSADFSGTPRVGGTACRQVTWTSDTILTCAVASGFWGGRDVSMEVMTQVGTLSEAFSYDEPLPTEVSPANQPTRSNPNMSVPIVLHGKNFGLWDHTPQVKLGCSSCIASQWVSDTALLCVAPSGVGGAQDVSAVVSLNQSATAIPSATTFHFSREDVVSFDLPVVLSRNSTNAPTAGASFHAIVGQGFGMWGMSPTVFVGDSAAVQTTWESDSSISFLSPPGLYSNQKLEIEVAQQRGSCATDEDSSYCTLSYDRPSMSRILGRVNAASSGGEFITVLGRDYGEWQHADLELSIGDTQCQTTTWQSGTSLVCKLPAGYREGLALSLELKAADSEMVSPPASLLTMAFTYDGILPPPPEVHQLLDADGGNANGPGGGGSVLTVIGSFLGPQALIPPEDLQIQSGGEDEPRFCVFGFELVAVGTPGCPFMEAQDVVWTASIAAPDFPSGIAVGTKCLETTWVSSSSLLCTVPPGSGSALGVRVDTAWFSDPITSLASGFSMRAPMAGNSSLPNFERGTFSYDNVALLPAVTANRTALKRTCMTDGGSERICDTLLSTSQVNRSTLVVDFHGLNFAPFDLSPAGRTGFSSCEATVWESDSSARCLPASGVGSTLSVALSIPDSRARSSSVDAETVPMSRQGSLQAGWGYLPVEIGGNGPFNVPQNDVEILIIHAHHLGSTDYSPRVQSGGTFCPRSTWTSDTSVDCRPPSGIEAERSVSVIAFSDHPNSSEPAALSAAVENSRARGTVLYEATRDGFFLTDKPQVRSVFGYTESCILESGEISTSVSGTDPPSAMTTSAATNLATQQTTGVESSPAPGVTPDSGNSNRRLLESGSHLPPTNLTCLLLRGTAGSSGSGSEAVTLVGGGFGTWDTSINVRVGGTSCESSAWISDSAARCLTPRGSHNDSAYLPVVVTVARRESDPLSTFQYDGIGAVRLEMEGDVWGDTSPGATTEVVEGQLIPPWQQPTVRVIDAFDRTAKLSEAFVTASIVGDTKLPELLGTTVLQATDGVVEFTDLRLDGAATSLRWHFFSDGVEAVTTRLFDARRGDCPRAVQSVSVTSGIDTGGVPIQIVLSSFRQVQPELVRVFFSARYPEDELAPIHLYVDAEVTVNEQFDELVVSALTPNWGTDTPRLVNVSLDLSGSSLAPTARPCFEFFMIESDVVVVASMAPRRCATFTSFGPDTTISLIIDDPNNNYPFPDGWDGVTAVVGSGDAQSSSLFDATNELSAFTKIGSFACPPMSAPGVYQVQLVGPEGLICCDHTRFEPDGGFQLEYVPPPSVPSPLEVFENGGGVQITLYFPRRFLDPAVPPMQNSGPLVDSDWSECVVFVGEYSLDRRVSGFSPITLVSSSETGDHAVISFTSPNVTQSSLPEGPSVLPISVQCRCSHYHAHDCGGSTNAVPTGARLTVRRLPKLQKVSPDSVYVTGGITVLQISSPAFPLPPDSLMVTASFRLPSGEITLPETQVRAELVSINPRVGNVQVTLPRTPNYFEGFFDVTVTPVGQSSLMVVKAVVFAVAPEPEILEMRPATLTTEGGFVTVTVAFIRANTNTDSMALTVGSEAVSISRVEYSDFLESQLSFPAAAMAPGSTPFSLAGVFEPERTAEGVLLVQAPQVTVTCQGFRVDDESPLVDAALDAQGLCIAPEGPEPVTSAAPPRPAVVSFVLNVAGSPSKQVTLPAFRIQGEDVGVTSSDNGRTLQLQVPSASLGIRLTAAQPPVRTTVVAEGSLVLVDSSGETENVDFVLRFAYLFAPRMQEVRFGNTGTFLTIVWSQPTDLAGLALGEQFDCERLLGVRGQGGTVRTLGIAPTCAFDTPQVLRLVLGENERGTPDVRIEPGDRLHVKQRNSSLSTPDLLELRTIDGWSDPALGDAEILTPTAAQPATVWLDGPSVVPSCATDELSITAVVTSTRDVSIVWGSDDDDLGATLSSMSGLTAELRSTELVVGQLYTIFVDVTDFLGSSTPRVSTQLEVTAGLIPVVKIEATGPFYRSQDSLVFGAITKFSSCETDKAKLVFDWRIYAMNAQTARRRSFLDRRSDIQPLWTGTEQSFEVPTGLLTDAEAELGTGSFEVTLTAGAQGKLQSSAVVHFEFDQQALIVGVVGGDRVHVANQMLILDASLSFDPDVCPEGCEEAGLHCCALADWFFGDAQAVVCDDPDLVITWTCTVGGPNGGPCRGSDMNRLEIESQMRVEVDTSDLSGNSSTLYFTVSASKGNRQSSTGVTIRLQEIVALELEIRPLVPQPSWNPQGIFQVVDFEDLKARTRLSNASVDYLATRPDASLFYSWSIFDIDLDTPEPLPVDNSAIAPLGRLGPLFVLNKFVLGLRKHYVIEVGISAEVASGQQVATGVARMAIVVNGPPEGGYCTVTPNEGVGMKTMFRFQCFKWNDAEVPLKYVFGYRSLDDGTTSEGEATVKPDKELRLPAGDWQAMMFVQDDLGSRTLPQLVDIAVNESTEDDSNREAEVEAQMDELDQLGDATSTTQTADAAGAEVNGDADGDGGSRRSRRRLLASSAAYRMRVRRMLLRKMSGNPASANARSSASQMQSQMKLSSQPTEVVPATGADADGSQGESALVASIAAVEVQGGELPLREVLKEAGENLLQTCDQIIGATTFLPPGRRSETFIRAARAVFTLREKMSPQILVGEAPKTFTKTSNVALAMHRVAVPPSGRVLVGPSALLDRTSEFVFQGEGEQDTGEAVTVVQSASALPDITGLLTSMAVAIEVPQSILDATESEVMIAPAAFKHAWSILGTPQEVLGRVITPVFTLAISDSRADANSTRRRRRVDVARRADPRDIEFTVSLLHMPFYTTFDIEPATAEFNASEADYFRRRAYVAVKCLHWNQIEWDTSTCNASHITNRTVLCDCSADGAVTVVWKYIDDSRQERFAVHAFPLRYTTHWPSLRYLICVGAVLAFFVWLLDAIFSSTVRRMSLLYRHDMEYFVPKTRGYHKMATGWYGSNKGARDEKHENWVRISNFLHLDHPEPNQKHAWRDKFLMVKEGSAQYYSSNATNVHTRNGCLRMEGSELLVLDEARKWIEDRDWDKENRPEFTKNTFILLSDKAAAETMEEQSGRKKRRAIKKMAMMGSFHHRGGSLRHRLDGSFREKMQVVPSQVETPTVLICQAQSPEDLAKWVDAVVCSKARARVGGIDAVYHDDEDHSEHGQPSPARGPGQSLADAELLQEKWKAQDVAAWGLEGKWMKLLAECKFMDQRRVGVMSQRRTGVLAEEMFRLAVANALEPDSAEETWEERTDMLVAAEAYVKDAERNRNGDIMYLAFISRRTGHMVTDSAAAAVLADGENGIVRPSSTQNSPTARPRSESEQSLMTRLKGAMVSGVDSSFVGAGDASLVLERASPTSHINYISQSPQPNVAPVDNWPLIPPPQPAGTPRNETQESQQRSGPPATEQPTRAIAELDGRPENAARSEVEQLMSEMRHAAHEARTHHKHHTHNNAQSATLPASETNLPPIQAPVQRPTPEAQPNKLTLQTQLPSQSVGPANTTNSSRNPTSAQAAPVPPPRSSRPSVSQPPPPVAVRPKFPAASAPSWAASNSGSGSGSGGLPGRGTGDAVAQTARAGAPPEHGPWHHDTASPSMHTSAGPASPESLVPPRKPGRVGLSSHWVQTRPTLPEDDIKEDVGSA